MSEQKQLNLEELTSRKVELESKSKATGLTEAEKGELVDLSLKIVEVEDEMEAAEAAKAKATTKKPAPKVGAPSPEPLVAPPPALAPKVKDSEAYTPKDEEKHLFHVELTKGQRFDPATGKPISDPYVQMFDRTAWNQFKQHQAVLGYESKVLWDPTQNA